MLIKTIVIINLNKQSNMHIFYVNDFVKTHISNMDDQWVSRIPTSMMGENSNRVPLMKVNELIDTNSIN